MHFTHCITLTLTNPPCCVDNRLKQHTHTCLTHFTQYFIYTSARSYSTSTQHTFITSSNRMRFLIQRNPPLILHNYSTYISFCCFSIHLCLMKLVTLKTFFIVISPSVNIQYIRSSVNYKLFQSLWFIHISFDQHTNKSLNQQHLDTYEIRRHIPGIGLLHPTIPFTHLTEMSKFAYFSHQSD